jgi:anti-anti-sigma factor
MFPGPSDLEVTIVRVDDVVTATVVGEIDLATSTQLNRELDTALDCEPPPARLRIDLAQVNFMDTSGVAVLLKARRRALEVGARFSVSSTSPAIKRLLEITGLTALLADD